jgi:hypothetical protein
MQGQQHPRNIIHALVVAGLIFVAVEEEKVLQLGVAVGWEVEGGGVGVGSGEVFSDCAVRGGGGWGWACQGAERAFFGGWLLGWRVLLFFADGLEHGGHMRPGILDLLDFDLLGVHLVKHIKQDLPDMEPDPSRPKPTPSHILIDQVEASLRVQQRGLEQLIIHMKLRSESKPMNYAFYRGNYKPEGLGLGIKELHARRGEYDWL